MKIAGNCSWKSKGEKINLQIKNIDMEFVYNDMSYAGDYVIDLEPPFSALSATYAPEKRIYVTTEPSLFDCYTNQHPAEEIDKYYKGLILSWHPLLRYLPQTKIFQPAARWVGPMDTKKEFGVSGFVSSKHDPRFQGYCLRHEILARDNEVKIPGIVYNHRKIWKGVPQEYPIMSKEPAFKYMFHLAIENCCEADYFTEKLIDCLACRAVPLYFGDPNIANVFDPAGMIFLDREKYMDQINALKPEDYTSRLAAIEGNFQRSMKYWSFDINVARLIAENLK